jgi:hypothetical protein
MGGPIWPMIRGLSRPFLCGVKNLITKSIPIWQYQFMTRRWDQSGRDEAPASNEVGGLGFTSELRNGMSAI